MFTLSDIFNASVTLVPKETCICVILQHPQRHTSWQAATSSNDLSGTRQNPKLSPNHKLKTSVTEINRRSAHFNTPVTPPCSPTTRRSCSRPHADMRKLHPSAPSTGYPSRYHRLTSNLPDLAPPMGSKQTCCASNSEPNSTVPGRNNSGTSMAR